jgi:hypothetical protein
MPMRYVRALKAAGLCATVALIVALAGGSGVSGIGLAAQAQEAPKPPEAAHTSKPTVSKPPPSAQELEQWRRTIVHTKRLEKACFTAEYPATTWTKVPCGKPPKSRFLPAKGPRPEKAVGGGTDDFAQPSGNISWAEGSFDAVLNVKSACSDAPPYPPTPKCTSGNRKNEYMLQLNTNTFKTSECNNHSECRGWEQFVFSNRFCENKEPLMRILVTHGTSLACAYIQYWLLGYGNGCPKNWNQSGGDCVADSQNSVDFVPLLVDDLGFMKLMGGVPGVHGQDDTLTFTYKNKAYSVPGDSRLKGLVQGWQEAEFNVFGDGGGSQAVFNSGSTLVVRIVTDAGTLSAPQCSNTSTGSTAETNNLLLTALPQGPWSKGPGPALVFAESNVPGTVQVKPCASASFVTVGGTN